MYAISIAVVFLFFFFQINPNTKGLGNRIGITFLQVIGGMVLTDRMVTRENGSRLRMLARLLRKKPTSGGRKICNYCKFYFIFKLCKYIIFLVTWCPPIFDLKLASIWEQPLE